MSMDYLTDCCGIPILDYLRISHWAITVWTWLWACLSTLLDVAAFVIVVLVLIGLIWASILAKGRQVTRCGALKTRRCPDGKRELLEDFTVKIEDAEPIIVEKGFRTDFSSIPTLLQWTMHWSKVDIAGVVHDWLYANAKTSGMKKLETDRIWRDIALNGERHASRLQAAAGWLALVLFGCSVWKRYKRNPPDDLLPKKAERRPPEDGGGETPQEGESSEEGDNETPEEGDK